MSDTNEDTAPLHPAHPHSLVVVGSSAGGIEAFVALAGSLREDFPAPIVLAQHLDPRRPSNLASLIERRTTLPVVLVEPESELAAGTIFIVPSNRHVVIQDGMVRVEGDHQDRPRPSIDLLLSSAAGWYGERLVAVILSGHGSDGADGAREVKEAGGVVVVQNPHTARHPSMPLALSPAVVDHVVDIERMGALLYDVLKGTSLRAADAEADDGLPAILARVSHESGIDFNRYKMSTILRRIERRMAITHCQTLRDYRDFLDVSAGEVSELAGSFLIKVTEFFRDAPAYEYLRSAVLPDLVERGRARGRVLRVWSAGCATGEEPYSLAILLAELLGPELPEWNIKLFATDVDGRSIEFARRGIYSTAALANVDDELRSRAFETTDQGYRVAKHVRQIVIFGQQDLSRGVPFPRIDLIVCRNLLIYFSPELQNQILESFSYSLTSGAYMFLGKAETARPSKAVFELVEKRWKIYRCVNCPVVGAKLRGPGALGLSRASESMLARLSAAPDERLATTRAEQAGGPLTEYELAHLRRFNDIILRLLPVGVAVIDAGYRLLMISGGARRLLGIRESAAEQDFLHAVRGLPYAQTRAAIDKVFRERVSVTLDDVELETTAGGDGRFLHMTIVLMQTEPGATPLAILSVSDVTEQMQAKRRAEAVQTEQAYLIEEIGRANKRLSEANQDLLDANEEMQATNEEIILTQEELQASNEELEATSEELQATNEELETNNEELQATNEELETTNDELTARTHELQALTRQIELERDRLLMIVEASPYFVISLEGPNFVVSSTNRRSRRLFGGTDAVGSRLETVLEAENLTEIVAALNRARVEKVETTIAPARTRVAGANDDSGGGGAPPAGGDVTLVFTAVPSRSDDEVVLYAREATAEETARPGAGDA